MYHKKIKHIVLLICITILGTIGIQLFWNYENYKTNELLILNEISNSFDKTVKDYYAEASKATSISFFGNEKDSTSMIGSAFEFLDTSEYFQNIDTTRNELPNLSSDNNLLDSLDIKVTKGMLTRENQKELDEFNSSITISISQDSINLSTFSKLFDTLLLQKKIKTNYVLEHYKKDSLFSKYGRQLKSNDIIVKESKSELLPVTETLILRYTNPVRSIFKRGLIGILVSLLLALGIIFSLLFLMKVIKKQKQLSEIKNDLIGNITHEFKTPIATVLAAIEGITDFSSKNHQEKTRKYLQISKDQLNRLNLMVEKLLETAAINSESLELQKTNTDLVTIVDKIYESAKNSYPNKNIRYESSLHYDEFHLDEFHFENALNNLIDNAAKYGGDSINIRLNKSDEKIIVSVADNGKGIPISQKEKIFEKFYRIQSGNQHDVKGFGIGLFYSKNIILKHGGNLELISTNNSNEFRISL